MKAKTFENLIRKVVREEIDYALNREIKSLKESLQNVQKPKIKENIPNKVTNSLKEKIMGTEPINTKPKPKLAFTNNATLNDLLNETAQGDTRLHEGTSPVSMEGDFSTIGDMPVESAPQEVVNAVTRDYSDLMKAIDKKKKHRP
jgi:hypothetical protein